MTYAFFTFLDRGNQKSTVTVALDDLDPATGANYPTLITEMDAIQTALEAVTEGVIVERALVATRERLTNVIPADGRREQKWLVRYQDDVTLKVYTMEIPNSDIDALPFNAGSDFVNINYTTAGALKDNLDGLLAALNTNVKSPVGNAITVISIEDVGRNT